jgi:hypothetical protein
MQLEINQGSCYMLAIVRMTVVRISEAVSGQPNVD